MINRHDRDTTPTPLKCVNQQISASMRFQCSVECHSLSSQVVVLSVSLSSQVGRVAQRRHYGYCNTSSTWTRLLSGTKTFQVKPTFSKGWRAGGGNLPSCKPPSLSLLPWVAQLPALPHSALSGSGLQSMTHMPAPAPSPLQPSDSYPLLVST